MMIAREEAVSNAGAFHTLCIFQKEEAVQIGESGSDAQGKQRSLKE
jgi:hypothetical protein